MAGLNITGLNQVLQNLNKEIIAIENRTKRGMMKAGLLVKRESNLKVPVEFGFLKASAYVELVKGTNGPGVFIGYTSSYAPYVHEALGKLKGLVRRGKGHKGKYWDPQGKAEPQFLKNALTENADRILKIIADDARIKK